MPLTASQPASERGADAALAALDRLVATLPDGVERPGQRQMAAAVAGALADRRHLLVQAGTGTGKSYAYLVPAILSGRRVVVVTATRALQEQLVGTDLPRLRDEIDGDLEFCSLKGRANYVCRARYEELQRDRAQVLPGSDPHDAHLDALDRWVAATDSGDRAALGEAVPDALWARVSVDSRECPGRARCAHGDDCFAEHARDRAAASDVVVVNAALYAADLAAGGAVLPDHAATVVDEAHGLEDVCAHAFGVELGSGRLRHAVAAVAGVLAADDGGAPDPAEPLRRWATRLDEVLGACPDDRPLDLDEDGLRGPVVAVGEAVVDVRRVLDATPVRGGEEDGRRLRARQALDALRGDVQAVLAATDDQALWVELRAAPLLRSASVDVGARLATSLFAERPVVLTSATLAVGGDFTATATALGLGKGPTPRRSAPTAGTGAAPDARSVGPDDAGAPAPEDDRPADPHAYDGLDVGSPFDHRAQAICYIAGHLPDPRSTGSRPAVVDEVEGLVTAAGGRSLVLCTSLAAASEVRERLRAALDVRVLGPDDLPRGRLLREFADDETSCLVGSLGLWQGIDVPGPSVSLVVIDRIPFARPDDPLATARRARATAARRDAFTTVDLPRAALLLAQGAGRLVRRAEDRGVVALLDPRLVTRRYGARLLASLPPMYRTTDPARVRAALARLAAARDEAVGTA